MVVINSYVMHVLLCIANKELFMINTHVENALPFTLHMKLHIRLMNSGDVMHKQY